MPSRNQFKTKEEYNEYHRKYREKKGEAHRAYNREYNKKWRQKNGYAAEYRYINKYPDKQRSRMLLNKAVASGEILKKPCVVCGAEKTQAHHIDYNKPFDVLWLCPLHHAKLHKQIKLSTTQ